LSELPKDFLFHADGDSGRRSNAVANRNALSTYRARHGYEVMMISFSLLLNLRTFIRAISPILVRII